MVLDKLGDSLRASLRKLVKASLIDPKLLDDILNDIKTALISADVEYKLAKEICDKIKERALKEKPAKTLTAREHTINIVYDELVKFLGEKSEEIKVGEKKPTKILLVGLFGSGKSTSCAKLAKLYKKQGLKVALVQTDTWRPAAYEQLKQLADKVHVPFYGIKDEKDPIKIIKKFEADYPRFHVVIFDSAGRDALNNELIGEIKNIKNLLKPDESLLVISGDIGQAAQRQAEAFKEATNITGVIVTKLDGTAKGGGALTACATTGAKVKFIGLGEHIEDLEEYKPKNFVSRLLGMGDLETLLKKAEDVISKEDAEKMGKKMMKGEFSLTDIYKQMEAMKKMGPLSQIASMIPGMTSIPKDMLEGQEDKMKSWKFLMDSMTPEEKESPDIINASRISRIAKGSGRPELEMRELLKQYSQMKKVMKMVGSPGKLKQLQKLMGKGGIPKGFKLPT